jgi:hypothetical protein
MEDRDSCARSQVGNIHLAKPDEVSNAFSTHIQQVYNIIHSDVVPSALSQRNDIASSFC